MSGPAKQGVLGLVKTLALEGAPVGIATAALCPARSVPRWWMEAQIADQAAAHGISAERVITEILLDRQRSRS